MINFKCERCGSSKLAYRKFVSCITPIQILEDETIYYGPSVVNEDDSLGVECRFICADCESTVYHRGAPLEIEGDLLYYLSLTNEERKQRNDEYFALIQDERDYEAEQRQKFEESICEIPEN